MKKLLAALVIGFASLMFADQVYWGIDVSASSSFYSTWNGSTAYSYIIQGTTQSAADSFVNGWSTTYAPTATTPGGSSGTLVLSSSSTTEMSTPTITSVPTGGSLVLILWNEAEQKGVYSWATFYSASGDTDPTPASGLPYFIESGYDVTCGGTGGEWKEFSVPEPTALALLALGVAGLALRRKQVA